MNIFRAAASQVDLEPIIGSWLTGFGLRVYPSDGQHDPLLAKAVLLEDGATQIAIVSCDLIGIPAKTIAKLRARIAEHNSIPANNIVISCTHTHSAPASMPFRGVLGYINHHWWSDVQDKIVALVAGLVAQLQPATLRHGTSQVEGISYNRQDQTHPIDRTLTAIAIDNAQGARMATLVNFALHPVTLSHGNLKISGDVQGEAMRRTQQAQGGIALYLQGACGDVNPTVDLKRGWGNGTFDDVTEMGTILAQGAADALQNTVGLDRVRLQVAQQIIELPLDAPPTPAQLETLIAQFESDLRKARVEDHIANEGIALTYLRWAAEVKGAIANGSLPRVAPIEVWLAAINDLRLVAVPLEPYSDIGLDFKKALLPLTGVLMGYANGLLGYCAADWAKEQGGYGPDDACRWFPEQLTPIARGAAQLVTDAAVRLAQAYQRMGNESTD